MEKKMNKRNLLTILITVLMLFPYVKVSAQEANPSGNLIYIRQRREEGFQLVSLSSAGRQVFNISRDDCSILSPDRTYLALSRSDSKEIDIYRLSDGEILSTTPLEETQSGCAFRWQSETILNLLDSSGTVVETSMNVLDGTILSVEEQTPSARPPVTVPDLLADDFRLMSPDNSLIVYNRCAGSQFTTGVFTDDQSCTSEEDVVIYDLRTQQVVQVLEDAQQGYFILDESENLAFSFGGISWSPSGRYLAYRTASSDQGVPPLRIYDIRDRRYLDLHLLALLEIDWFKGFTWVQGDQRLAFWSRDYEVEGQQLAVVNLQTGEVSFSRMRYQLAQANWEQGFGNTIVFVDSEHNLVEYDLDTDNTTVLDTDVWDILSP